MPIFKFEAMDARGEEIRDVIEAPSEEEAKATIRQMGYFVTMITQIKPKPDKPKQEDEDYDKFILSPSITKGYTKAWSATEVFGGISFNEISRIIIRCIVAVMFATLLFSFAKTGSFNHNLFIEALLLAIYNKLIK